MVTSQLLYGGFLLALGGERLAELLLSRRNARRALARGAVELGRPHFVAMAILHAAFLPACLLEVVLLSRAFPGALGYAALAVALLAQGMRYWAIATLGERWNVRIIVLPDAPPVTSGPYRFIRHPNYVAVVAEMLAVPLIHGAWLTAAVFSALNAIVLTVRIRAEEAALGTRYAELLGRLPRFVPGGRARPRRPPEPAAPLAEQTGEPLG